MATDKPSSAGLRSVFRLLERLEAQGIAYRLDHVRDALMVQIAVPGERWEVEYFADGRVEVERFVSRGEIEHAGVLDLLLADHG